ncbi:MAG: patatin-like phospholipase family protein [Methylobacterium radiotolerans]
MAAAEAWAEISKPRLPCDIVMAGGVTSGIIYPGAVAEIAKRYGFHAVGGTSVGAIAAAVTAAAEYGRRTGRNPAAFEFVATLPASLGAKAPDGRTRLLHLFTPEPGTRRLMDLLLAVFAARGFGGKALAVGRAAIRSVTVAASTALVFALGLLPVVILARDGALLAVPLAAMGALALVVIVLIGAFAVVLRKRWLPGWRANGYGACTGLADPHPGDDAWRDFVGLTSWIHASVQAAAGRGPGDPPLTFGDLWGAPGLDGGSFPGEVTASTPRSIELAMIASDLSRNRTVQLPFLEAPTPLYVERAMLDRYFPSAIVEWMVGHAGHDVRGIETPKGFYRLPAAQHLPVAFGARLSLSFPVLLCAVPLWTLDFSRKTPVGKPPLRKVWFSDGGLTSNFPLHFFDRPLPAHPTFCFNLVAYDAQVTAGRAPADDDAEEIGGISAKPIGQAQAEARRSTARPEPKAASVPPPGDPTWGFLSMADRNRAPPVQFTVFDEVPGIGLGAFLGTLVNTARFWSDNQLLAAPGYRDRVVHVALRDDEGGLNLDMDAKVIADLDRRGRAAGALIAARFDPTKPSDPETGAPAEPAFPNHRWVRFRAFMAAVEDLSRRFARSRECEARAAVDRGEASLSAMMAGPVPDPIGYEPDRTARPYYARATTLLDGFAADLAAETARDDRLTFDVPREQDGGVPRRGGAPRPKMTLRPRPLVDNDPMAEMVHPLAASELSSPPSPDLPAS